MYFQLLFCGNVRFGVPYPEIMKVVIRIWLCVFICSQALINFFPQQTFLNFLQETAPPISIT